MVEVDVEDDHLRKLVGNKIAQRLVAEDTAFDFVVASRIEAAVSMDPLHMRALAARLERGDAVPAYGGDALDILVPELAEISWDDIADIRRHRELRSLRSVLSELEAAAWEGYQRGGDMEAAVRDEYEALLERGQRHAFSFSRGMRAATIAVVVSLFTGLIPPVPAAAMAFFGALAHEAVVARRYDSSWLASLMEIRRRSQDTRLASEFRY